MERQIHVILWWVAGEKPGNSCKLKLE